MGYTTDFSGEFTVTPPLTASHAAYLRKFAATRRMKRVNVEEGIGNREIAPPQAEEGLHKEVGLPWGIEGEFYVDHESWSSEGDETVIDHNTPPSTQPGLWCQWVPGEDGSTIVWDGGEKFYDYVEWLQYIVDNFLKRWGYQLDGEVDWQGEDGDDFGKIVAKGNAIRTRQGRRTYED